MRKADALNIGDIAEAVIVNLAGALDLSIKSEITSPTVFVAKGKNLRPVVLDLFCYCECLKLIMLMASS
jgi:hypothetical protein